MAAPTSSVPLLLRYGGDILSQACAQATHASAGAHVHLAKIDYTAKAINQQWQFGSDGRIYLYNNGQSKVCLTFEGDPQNGAQLVLAAYDPTDNNQVWEWHGIILKNKGALEFGDYCIDNNNGGTQPGNKIQLWHIENSNHQFWIGSFPFVEMP